MITAVDTNVLLDIFDGTQEFSLVSSERIRKCHTEGALVACDLVWAELAAVFEDRRKLNEAMRALGMTFSPSMEDTAIVAGEAWKAYRHSGGKRTRMIADFIIGAHAEAQCDRLLTRDRGFYRTHFKHLRVEDPSE